MRLALLIVVRMINVLKDCFVWLMDHVRRNVILMFIVLKNTFVLAMELAN